MITIVPKNHSLCLNMCSEFYQNVPVLFTTWVMVLSTIDVARTHPQNAKLVGAHNEIESELQIPDFYSDLIDGCVADCESEIYCHGEILHDIEMARIYEDSKTFVDKKLLYSEQTITSKYRALKDGTNNKPTLAQLRKFIDENFADDAFDLWIPPDFKEIPSLVNRIEDEAFRKWILELNQIWKDLAQKMTDDVRENPERHSYLWVPHGFIKAGGRFREMYYWDSYWVVKGLLLCDMFDTARGIIENMIWLVKVYGHMPNGNRKYYQKRSQPPLLIQMAHAYYTAKKDDDLFIQENLQHFETEFHFWYNNRMVDVHKDGETYRLARYNAVSCTPRPESYYEDYKLAANIKDKLARMKLFTGIKSAAESAWDFSSRDFRASDGSNKGTLLDLEPQNLLFVDLNAILHTNAKILSEWFKLFNDDIRSQYYKKIADQLFIAIDKVFWNEEFGVWMDYDPILKKHRKYFYPSNLTPLWTESYPFENPKYIQKVIDYLRREEIIKSDFTPNYICVPASKNPTSEQWDFPNCWPPLQAFVIQGLERTHHPIASFIAFKLAQSWINTMYTGFLLHGYMFEKYSALEIGTTGAGGEYSPQRGFGWTNGFCMELFDKWGKYFRLEDTQMSKLQ